MEPYGYNVDTRFINGRRLYRYRCWDKTGTKRTEICAGSYDELTQKTRQAGYRIRQDKTRSQVHCNF